MSPYERALLGFLYWLGRLRSERGQTMGEYAVIVSVIAVTVAITALVAFRTQFAAGFDTMSNCLNGGC